MRKPSSIALGSVRFIYNGLDLVGMELVSPRDPTSEGFKRRFQKNLSLHEKRGRKIGAKAVRVYRGVEYTIELTKDGWLLDGETYFPTLAEARDEIVPEELKSYRHMSASKFFGL